LKTTSLPALMYLPKLNTTLRGLCVLHTKCNHKKRGVRKTGEEEDRK